MKVQLMCRGAEGNLWPLRKKSIEWLHLPRAGEAITVMGENTPDVERYMVEQVLYQLGTCSPEGDNLKPYTVVTTIIVYPMAALGRVRGVDTIKYEAGPEGVKTSTEPTYEDPPRPEDFNAHEVRLDLPEPICKICNRVQSRHLDSGMCR